MLNNLRRRPRRAAARALPALAAVTLLALAGPALAAHPKKGAHFTGTASGPGLNGFKNPVSFSVSSNGKRLQHFSFGTLGCFGAGGFKPGVDPFTSPYSMIHVGTVSVTSAGKFSVTGAISKYTAFGTTTETTVGVSGHFTKSKSATLTVTFSQKLSVSATSVCGPATLNFTATAH